VLSFEEARERLLAAALPIGEVEAVRTEHAAGRVLGHAVTALVDVPAADNAQMDGYAVRCADLAHVPARLPVALRIAAGAVAPPLPLGAAARIFTGAPLPAGCDAVVMQEEATAEGDDVVLNRRPQPGQWIRRAGSDFARGSVALPAGQALGPQHLGVAASVGIATLAVVRRPRVSLLCTGDELAMPGDAATAGDGRGRVFNSNRFVLAALLEALGCVVHDLGIVRDAAEATKNALEQAAVGADLIISAGGVSVGDEDHVKAAVASLGSLQLWGVAMKPGKPLAFGQVGTVPFIGLPGNPVSSFTTFVMLVRPYLLKRMGANCVLPRAIALPADFARAADSDRREFARVRRDGAGRLELYRSQNSALLSSVAWADGLADIPPGTEVVPGMVLPYLGLNELTGPP
jgi:molybdopterin molybdotransferase